MATHFYVSDFSLGDRSECRRRAHRWNTRCRKGAELTPTDIRCCRSLAASLSIMSQHAIVRRPMRGEG